MTGISSPYEEPQSPEIILETEKATPKECLDTIIKKLGELGYLKDYLPGRTFHSLAIL